MLFTSISSSPIGIMLFTKGFKSPNPSADIRYLPKGLSLPVRTMIYGNKVVIVDFTKPITSIIIEKKKLPTLSKNISNYSGKLQRSKIQIPSKI